MVTPTRGDSDGRPSPDESCDIAVVGGGAAGLTAAIFAAQSAPPGHRVVVLDGAKTLGAKILVSGGGRCNVTHEVVTADDFNGRRNPVRNILAAFDAPAAVAWFSSMGVELKREETGKLFPVADSAKAVVAALLRRCAELNVELKTGCRVEEINAPADTEPRFTVVHPSGRLRCRRLIVATGGKSLPRSGSDGSGWELLRRLGHTVTLTHAALVPLVLDPTMFHADVSGIAMDVELSTFQNNKRIDHRTGSLLFTHFGISGPVVMDASRHYLIADETGTKPLIKCNLFPGESFEQVDRWLVESTQRNPRARLINHFPGRLPDRIAAAVLKHVKIDPATIAGQLPRDSRRLLVHALTALVLPVSQHRGWNYAEVTAGGVPLDEIDFRTCQSRRIPGLYLAGEVLDCDGRIGGFNFQWAWATGYLAGTASAAEPLQSGVSATSISPLRGV